MTTLLFDGIARGDVVAAAAIESLDDDEFEAALRRLLEIKHALATTELRFLDAARRRGAHVRHGFRDTGSWVASLAGERTGAVRRDLTLAEQVASTPVVAAVLESGSVSKTQAGVLVSGAALPVDVQERLVSRADVLSVAQLGQAVRAAQLDHGITPADPLPHLDLSQTDTGGRLEANLDAEGYELVNRAVHAVVGHLGLPKDLPMAHRRAVALVGLARHYLEHAETAPPDRIGVNHALVMVDLETLLADRGGSAVLSSGAVISGDTARRIACDAGISRIITRGRSEILDVGRATRSISPALAKAVIARDRHCTHPGCHAPPWLCEIHHRVPWALGGTTDLDGLELQCWYHHHLEHARDPVGRRRRTEAA